MLVMRVCRTCVGLCTGIEPSSHVSCRMAQLLLTHGADVNCQDEFSRADRVAAVKRMRTSESNCLICMHQ